jgi:hypothetical protein
MSSTFLKGDGDFRSSSVAAKISRSSLLHRVNMYCSKEVCVYIAPFQKYMLYNSTRVLMIPQSHEELQEAIAEHQRLSSEVPEREAVFQEIRDQYDILCKSDLYSFVKSLDSVEMLFDIIP